MDFYFEKWWKNIGRYQGLVNMNLEKEELYKKFAEIVWKESKFYQESNDNDCKCN